MRLSTITLFMVLFLTSNAVVADTVRLVLTENKNTSKSAQKYAKSTKADLCVFSERGDAKWCLPPQKSPQIKSKSVGTSSRTQVFEVDSQGYTSQEIADSFNRNGSYGLVEVDLPIKAVGFTPNDPSMYRQKEYLSSTEENIAGINITGLWDAVGKEAITEKSAPIDIIVMDSSFTSNTEVEYFDGRSFSTTALEQGGPNQARGNDYRPPAEVADLHCNPHGLGVTGVINAKLDNAIGTAGITNNANVYALRVMTCGTGFASDVTAALDWLAGEHFEGVTPYQGEPGIVNLSLGGSSNDTCPNYIQTSINRAVEAGFTIIVAASNDSKDVSNQSPANCENVITVASVDSTGDLASFSNYGDAVNVVTIGTDIQSPCTDDPNSSCWWEGTSFSTPLIAGGLAVVKQQTGASNEILMSALELSSSLEPLNGQCLTGICGNGLPDFAKVLDIVEQSQTGTLNTIEFALNASDSCEQTWFIDHFGDKARLCELYKISFFGGYTKPNSVYQMVSIAIDDSWDTGEFVYEGDFEQGTVMLTDLDISNKRFGFRACRNGACTNVYELDTTMAHPDLRPQACITKQ